MTSAANLLAARRADGFESRERERAAVEAALCRLRVRCVLKPPTRIRAEIPESCKWDVGHIFPDWLAWQEAYTILDREISAFALRAGTLGSGPDALLATFEAQDALGQLAYRVYSYPALQHDEDQRDNDVAARHQQVQLLLSRWQQATSWFSPELLQLPLDLLHEWMASHPRLATYQFAVDSLFHQREHVLDAAGERLLALAGRVEQAPAEAFSALSTADAQFPSVTLVDGRTTTVTYGEYRSLLATARDQRDRVAAFRAFHEYFGKTRNTYASLYGAVCQRDWFVAQARGYHSTIEAALHGNAIPTAVVDTLIAVARRGAEPLRRYHRLRQRALGLERYYPCDAYLPLLDMPRTYGFEEAREWVIASVAPLGEAYQRDVRACFANRSIDVYENDGKRSGAYSAPVYGVHPYMLLNHNDTLDAVFTLAHEMGHNLHTVLAHRAQPFVYADYTIFVAEVASTLNESLLLDYLLAHRTDPRERVVLLQHALDSVAGTFYTQALFADFELRVHRLVEHDEPITAEILSAVYRDVFLSFYGETFDDEPLVSLTWTRIPHLYQSPYYVYQYATCFASAARIGASLREGDERARQASLDRYLDLLSAGGCDYPMRLLARAGVNLEEDTTVEAVVSQFDGLVSQLETELSALEEHG